MAVADTESIARGVFAEIAKRFPKLNMVENRSDPVEISITIPVQPGLSHQVWLCLQNGDELGFSAGHFYNEWFPCTKQETVERYIDAVSGLISGRLRILEHWRGRRTVKAQLQSPDDGKWVSIATSANISALVPWPPKTLRIVQNKA